MSDFQVDITNCDREPIHIPGKLQSQGFMLVLDQQSTICCFSDNIGDFIPGISKSLLNKKLSYFQTFLGFSYQPNFIEKLIDSSKDRKSFERTNPVPVDIFGRHYYLIISISGDYFLLEFEPAISNHEVDIQGMIGRSIAEILSFKEMSKLLINTAIQVKSIIEFDRVMVYRFAEDGHGEVVAEEKNENLESWLGLHYPASDIPKQARELYKLNLTRLIADVSTTTSNIVAYQDKDITLDLTYSQLRAVSPMHIQYLKNMGVASSFSISLMCNGELWGLIACHNYTPRFIDYKSREYAKLIGQILSSAIEFRQDEEKQREMDAFKTNLEKLVKQLQENDSIEGAITAKEVTILDIVKASGAALVYNNMIFKLGITPDDEQLLKLTDWLNQTNKEFILLTDNFSSIYPEAANYKEVASGVVVSVLSKELGDYLIWFKPEQIKTVNWAGNPDKPVELASDGSMQISPRHSFEVWSETVSGISQKWSEEDIKSVTRLKEEINYAINMKAGAAQLLNDRLRQAYEDLETFSYTISHDLKSPIASIKGYAQLLMKDQMVIARGQKLMQRIAERADQMNLMINAVLDYSKIGKSRLELEYIQMSPLIDEIVKDLEITHSHPLEVTIGDVHDLKGDAIMMLQIFSNLIGNAAKYSKYSDPAKIHIEAKIIGDEVVYSVRDNGLGIAEKDFSKIFELFHRMDNVKDIDGSGVGLAIVKRVVEKHNGRIWVESELNQGSTFFVAFSK